MDKKKITNYELEIKERKFLGNVVAGVYTPDGDKLIDLSYNYSNLPDPADTIEYYREEKGEEALDLAELEDTYETEIDLFLDDEMREKEKELDENLNELGYEMDDEEKELLLDDVREWLEMLIRNHKPSISELID